MSAKIISKAAKIVTALAMIGAFCLKWAGVMPEAGAGEIVMCFCAAYAVAAGTIDVNIMLDKLTGKGVK